jgi:hypothetical protein
MTHLGGAQGDVAVLSVVVEAEVVVDVTKTWMTSVSDAVVALPPLVPAIVTAVVLEAAALGTLMDRVEVMVPPAGGVTGLGLNPPETPAGKEDVRVTGELKPPAESTVTITVPIPPGLRTTLLGLTERLNKGVAVTVNSALADLPVLPITRIV